MAFVVGILICSTVIMHCQGIFLVLFFLFIGEGVVVW